MRPGVNRLEYRMEQQVLSARREADCAGQACPRGDAPAIYRDVLLVVQERGPDR